MRPGKRLTALALAAAAGLAAAAQGISPFLPSAQRSRAAGLLSIIDESEAGIDKRRAATLQAFHDAERASLAAYAAASATSVSGRWAGPDGSPAAGAAQGAFLAARSQAASALRDLAVNGAALEGQSVSSLESSREASADKLVALIAASRPDAKAKAGIASFLESKVPRLVGLFPEAAAIGSALKKSGSAGLDLWIAALARRGCEAIAQELLSLRDEALRIVPDRGGEYDGLSKAAAAYCALCESLPWTAQPAGILDPESGGAGAFLRAVESCLALPEERSLDLVDAMSRGDGRERTAAEALRRLGRTIGILPPARSRHLAAAAGVGTAKLLELAARFALASDRSVAVERRAIARNAKLAHEASKEEAHAVDALWVSLAERLERERGLAPGAFAEGRPLLLKGFPDPLLGLLENPRLMEIARVEPRYARFYADAGSRLGRLYGAADAAACADLAADPGIAAAASRALGGTAASISLRAVEIATGDPSVSRNVAFVAHARGQAGGEADFPVDADAAFHAYAEAFEREFGLEPAPAPAAKAASAAKNAEEAASLLLLYRQRVLEACLLPDGSAIALESLPDGGGFGAPELEAALVSGELP